MCYNNKNIIGRVSVKNKKTITRIATAVLASLLVFGLVLGTVASVRADEISYSVNEVYLWGN